MRRTESLSLDGRWDVQLDPGAAWRPIVVPFTFEAPLSGIGAGGEVHERVRYRRRFEVPWRRRTLLRFGAVDWRATVYVDGREVGEHEGGYTSFFFDLGRLAPGEHELVVDVYDPADDGAGQAKGKQRGSHEIWYTRTTGIWQSVRLEAVPDEYIVDLSSPDVEKHVIGLEDEPRLWSPEDPYLYDVEYRLGEDVVYSYAGFRTIETRGRELLLNGEPLFVRGILDQGFWPDGVYTAPTADALRADVEAAKAMGFNLARKHVKVEDARWYEWCDRLGLLVAQDMPSSHDLSRPEARDGFRREWLEIVDQLRRHPSIVLWIPINEDWGRPPPDFQRELVRATRATDPKRLVIDASGWKQLDDTDLIDVHDYGAELEQHRKHSNADIPVWIGECGGISLHVEGHAGEADFAYRDAADAADLVEGYRKLVEQIDPAEVAGFVWTQLTDVEGELNGLLTYDRVPKAPLEELRKINDSLQPQRL